MGVKKGGCLGRTAGAACARLALHLRALHCPQIIIAHRLSTIRNADLILVLDQGTITERGMRAELLNRQGFYRRLIQS